MRFAFKSYILPILDYSSQLWAPLEGHNMNKIENILRSFSSKVNGLKYLNYWERLEKLKLFSMTRRYERYRMIYTWKILTNNAHNCGLSWSNTDCKGITFNLPKYGQFCKSIRKQSFMMMGPLLFNSLPRYLRDDRDSNPKQWKEALDMFLSTIPDTPQTPDLTPTACTPTSKATNSLMYWIPHLGLSDRRYNPSITLYSL